MIRQVGLISFLDTFLEFSMISHFWLISLTRSKIVLAINNFILALQHESTSNKSRSLNRFQVFVQLLTDIEVQLFEIPHWSWIVMLYWGIQGTSDHKSLIVDQILNKFLEKHFIFQIIIRSSLQMFQYIWVLLFDRHLDQFNQSDYRVDDHLRHFRLSLA